MDTTDRTTQSERQWHPSISEAMQMQKRIAGQVRFRPLPKKIRLIAGADVAIDKPRDQLIAGVVVWDPAEAKTVEQVVARSPLTFPYVPGLLSFREAPAVIEAFGRLRSVPDVAMFDGQGYAHPRRCGLACHLGVLLNIPSIGCAKSRLTGTYVEPDSRRGHWTDLVDGDEMIGAVVRTRDGVKPLYISVGHKATLPEAVDLVLRCVVRYRLPEPTRLAHQLVTAEKKR